MSTFTQFYEKTYARLAKKLNTYNEEARRDPNLYIVPIREDMADLNEGGKLLRGILVSLGYSLSGKRSLVKTDDLAIAIELFQTGVLIHDDIIDRAKERRGKETIPNRYFKRMQTRKILRQISKEELLHTSEAIALCAGDFLLYEANRYLTEHYRKEAVLPDLILTFDEMVKDTIRGEMLDVMLPLESCGFTGGSKEESDALLAAVFDIYRLKTAQYSVVGPLRLGMILGGMPKSQQKKIDDFAEDLGIAFQIKDDLLGIYADTKHMGKDAGSDIAENKQTILSVYVRVNDPAAYRELKKVYGVSPVTKKTIRTVQTIFTQSGAKAYAEAVMKTYFARAEEKVKAMSFLTPSGRETLLGLVEYNRDRQK